MNDNTKNNEITMQNGSYIYGDYALTSVRNAWNDKMSYWLSKKGCTVSVYCFTPLDYYDLKPENVINHIKSAIPLLESKLKNVETA